jgi:DNA invertase Pin-like site-specific DNA recombinase
MSKCICLSRVSTGIQDLDQQTDRLIEAAKSAGYSDDSIIIIEDVESGIKLSEEERYGLNMLKTEINKGGIDLVIIFELSRLGRRPDVLYSVRDFLIKHKVQLQVLNPAFLMLKQDGTLDENSNILFSLFSGLAENEMTIKKARFKRGRAKKAAENRFVGGGILFGYTIDQNKKFIIKEDDAAVVRRIFDEYVEQNKTFTDIAKGLVLDGTYKDSMNSCRMMVERTLNNESYYGKPLQEQDVYYKATYQRSYPPIISKDLFEEAKAKRASNRKSQKKKSLHQYLCRGLVFNTEGKPFYANWSSNSFCCVLEHTAEKKTMLTISISALDELVWNNVKFHILNSPRKDISEEKIDLSSKIQAASNVIKTLEERLNNTADQLKRLELRIIKGKLSEIDAEDIEKQIEKERSEIKEDILQKQEEINALKNRIKRLENSNYEITEEELNSLDFNQKREYVLQNVQRIVVSKITAKKRLVSIFHNLADDGMLYELNCYSKTWKEWKIEYPGGISEPIIGDDFKLIQ